MSNEVKVGILAVVAIALSIWGYKFIRGKNVLLKANTYKVYYPRVDRMQVGTQIFINGVEVGNVASVNLLNDVDRTVEVILDLKPGMEIPKNTKAVIVSTGFMGGKAIMLEYPRPCSGDDCARSGDVLEGEIRGLLGSMVGEDNVAQYMDIVKKGLEDVIDTLNAALLEDPDSPLGKSMKNLESTLANLNSATGQLDGLLRSSSGSIEGTLDNLNGITGNLQRNNDKINSILGNADSLSSQLVAADLEKTLREVNEAIAGLKTTLQSADTALDGFSGVMGKIRNGEGSLGKLMSDEELYNNINELSHRADSLINDFQGRPYRYMPFKSRSKVKKFDRKDAVEGQ
ncbi:MAG: MCE family protein [Lewinellaceae bacterium]|nr:MCE family protein [Phaeodactylibacter sp.]MCB9040344.1 MCE family protein [Lewinellaceae bacterium]